MSADKNDSIQDPEEPLTIAQVTEALHHALRLGFMDDARHWRDERSRLIAQKYGAPR